MQKYRNFKLLNSRYIVIRSYFPDQNQHDTVLKKEI